MAGLIDDEAEAADPVLVGRDEETSLLGARATSAARRGDDFNKAGLLIRRDRRYDDPVVGVLLLEGAPILLTGFAGLQDDPEEPRFIERYGDDNQFRSHKFYGYEDKETFERIRSEMIRALPSPRRFVSRVQGPKGATVHYCWHTGPFWSPNLADRWEDYRYHTSVVL